MNLLRPSSTSLEFRIEHVSDTNRTPSASRLFRDSKKFNMRIIIDLYLKAEQFSHPPCQEAERKKSSNERKAEGFPAM